MSGSWPDTGEGKQNKHGPCLLGMWSLNECVHSIEALDQTQKKKKMQVVKDYKGNRTSAPRRLSPPTKV